MPPPPDVTTTKPTDWLYVSEGGATIVFSYSGPTHPEFSGTVLRLRKLIRRPPPEPILKPLDVAEEWIRKKEGEAEATLGLASDAETSAAKDAEVPQIEEEEPDDPTIEFQDKITSKLIPARHLPRLEAVQVRKDWLEQLAAFGEDSRPPERRTHDGIDVGKTKAVLATDLVGGNGWSVEIKPKWAFLASPTHLSPETLPIKTKHCRFCMHAHYKAGEGETAATGYCPLDLYSGQRERVIKAVHALWNSWVSSNGGVNNLRIFVKGKTLSPTDPASVSLLASYLLPSHSGTPELAELLPPFTDALIPLLIDTPLVQTLARLQRTLDPLDIEGLATLWTQVPTPSSPGATPVGSHSPEPTIAEWMGFTSNYLGMGYLNVKTKVERKPSWTHKFTDFTSKLFRSSASAPRYNKPLDHAHPRPDQLRYYMLAYLLSATFKDCSVILRLGREGTTSHGHANISTKGNTITAIDLDPKSMDRLSKWEKLDRKIVQNFAKALAAAPEDEDLKRECVDAGSSL